MLFLTTIIIDVITTVNNNRSNNLLLLLLCNCTIYSSSNSWLNNDTIISINSLGSVFMDE